MKESFIRRPLKPSNNPSKGRRQSIDVYNGSANKINTNAENITSKLKGINFGNQWQRKLKFSKEITKTQCKGLFWGMCVTDGRMRSVMMLFGTRFA